MCRTFMYIMSVTFSKIKPNERNCDCNLPFSIRQITTDILHKHNFINLIKNKIIILKSAAPKIGPVFMTTPLHNKLVEESILT